MFIGMGIKEENIIVLLDKTSKEIDSVIKEFKALAQIANKDVTKSVSVFIYYSGHGVMNNTSWIVCNEDNNQTRYFPLENRTNSIATSYKNTSFTVFFDCCREKIDPTQMKIVLEEEKDQSPWYQLLN